MQMKSISVEVGRVDIEVPESIYNELQGKALEDWIWQQHQVQFRRRLVVKDEPKPKAITYEHQISSRKGEDVLLAIHDSVQKDCPRRRELQEQLVQVQRLYLLGSPADQVWHSLLSTSLKEMESERGYIVRIHYDNQGKPIFQVQAWDTHSQSDLAATTSHVNLNSIESLLAEILRSKQPVIWNTPIDSESVGFPSAAGKLSNFAAVPCFHMETEDCIGLLGFANRRVCDNYPKDLSFLEPITTCCSGLIHAYENFQRSSQFIAALEEKVTERTQDLENAKARLELANQQQLRHFACMNHEIRTPLNCILGLSNLLLDSDLTRVQQDSLKLISTSGNLLLTVVNDVLEYSRLEAGSDPIEKSNCALQEILDSVVRSCTAKKTPRPVHIRTNYGCDVPAMIHTDGKRLQRILFNLMGNAIKFSTTNPNSVNEGSETEGVVEFSASLVSAEERDETLSHSLYCIPKSTARKPQKTSAYSSAKPQQQQSETKLECCPFHSIEMERKQLNRELKSTMRKVCDSTADTDSTGEDSQSQHTSSESIDTATAMNDHTVAISSPRVSPAIQVGHFSSPISRKFKHRKCPKTRRWLRFSVKDYGMGINEADVTSIFHPFFQASCPEAEQVRGGTGLGLAITAELVQALGGSISVDSVKGEWTRFVVDLPCDSSVIADIPSILKTTTVVLVDDVRNATTVRDDAVLSNIFEEYGVAFEHKTSLAKVQDLVSSLSTPSCTLLVHEDCYDESQIDVVRRSIPTGVISFGPRISVPSSVHHLQSLIQMVPCALVNEMAVCIRATTKERSYDEVPSTPTSTETSSSSLWTPPVSPVKVGRRDSPVRDIPNLRVLVAEDNPINQKLLSRFLRRLGVEQVDMVDNGCKAVALEAKEQYDVILMDYQMPVMDGVEACKAIQGRDATGSHPIPPVVFITAHVSSDIEAACRGAGGVDFLSKPYDIDLIESCLRAHG